MLDWKTVYGSGWIEKVPDTKQTIIEIPMERPKKR